MSRLSIVPPAAEAHPEVSAALRACKSAFWTVAIFSGVVNILMFAGPLYMLQVYDRVLASRSLPTLVALTVFLIGAYAFQAAFDLIRTRIVVRSAAALDDYLGGSVHAAVVRLGVESRSSGQAQQPVRDLDQIRSFLTGSGPVAIVDMPWMPVFLFVCFMLHPLLGLVSAIGAAILVSMTLMTERASSGPARDVAREAGIRGALIEADRRNSETATAMGMTSVLGKRWAAINSRYLGGVQRSADVVGTFGSITKVLRLLLQSAILGVGAWLVILGELTPGAMIAASIMMGRALAPIEAAIANWRGFVSARQSIWRLSELLSRMKTSAAATELPKPKKNVDVDFPRIGAPGGMTAIVSNVRFRLNAGEALGIIGPSGAGKTSLMRALVGIWKPAAGAIRLDGATFDQWNPERLGSYIGYVSQAAEVFDGTIAENISRMSLAPDNAKVLEAASAAGVHDLVLRLPQGYDTPIGDGGLVLSAGQRQRIALARALYDNPFLIALDEPHANLDQDGEQALNTALQNAKARGAVVILIAHRPTALAVCDKVLVVANGAQQAFGPRDEVLGKVLKQSKQAAPSVNLKVVGESAERKE